MCIRIFLLSPAAVNAIYAAKKSNQYTTTTTIAPMLLVPYNIIRFIHDPIAKIFLCVVVVFSVTKK